MRRSVRWVGGAAGATALALCLLLVSAAAAEAVTWSTFSTPSKNIACVISKTGARCDIKQKSWRAPRKPASCHLDWGFGLTLGRRGKADYVCAGDTVLGARRVLGYGKAITRGRVRCLSRKSGVRCFNRRNGHGFALSRQRARLF